MNTPSKGVFYAVTGEKHRRLCRRSIESLRQTNPALPLSVFTDLPDAFADLASILDGVLPIPDPVHGFADKIHGFLHAPYDHNLFLDADTVVTGELEDVFGLLDRFDFAAAHAPGHSGARVHDYESPSLPRAFVQFNTGVVCFRRSPAVLRVIEQWRKIYSESSGHLHDQPALRAALYQSGLSLYVLPPEYNLLPAIGYVSGPVKIIHSSAPIERIRALQQALEIRTGPRLLRPGGAVEPLFVPKPGPFQLAPELKSPGAPDHFPASLPPEEHLLIVWEAGRSQEARILEDLRARFEILAVCEMRWSADLLSDNFTRFYGQKLPPRSFKEQHCGGGPFLVVILRDPAPRYENRTTSKGDRVVNVHTFDAKQTYRQWTGGGHRIHATDTPSETRHDLTLLFGVTLKDFLAARPHPWNGRVEPLDTALAGARGWDSLEQFFAVLNETVRYLVLRNFAGLPGRFDPSLHGDIDLLTDAPEDLAFIAGGSKVFPKPHRVHYAVPIGGGKVLFDFRFVGDGYYDRNWQQAMLDRRVPLSTGIYAPSAEDHFYSLLHHALIHKRAVAPDYMARLRELGAQLDLDWTVDLSFANPRLWRGALQAWQRAKGYSIPRPADASVYFNEEILEGSFEWESIRKGLPLAAPTERLLSARTLAQHDGKAYFSYVFLDEAAGTILKQASDDLAWRDARLLMRLEGPCFPRALSARQHDGWSEAVFERIQGRPLHHVIREIAATPKTLAAFFEGCLDILDALQKAGLTHRDIHAQNIIVREGRPVLIDFGWAVAPDMPCFTPLGLGQGGRPPDSSFCDVYAMGKVLAQCAPANSALFSPLVSAMTAEESEVRLTSAPALRQKLREANLPDAWPVPPTFTLAPGVPAFAAPPSAPARATPPPLSPEETKQARLDAGRLFAEGQFEAAAALYQRLTKTLPKEVEIKQALIACYEAQGYAVMARLLREEIEDEIRRAARVNGNSHATPGAARLKPFSGVAGRNGHKSKHNGMPKPNPRLWRT